MGYIKVLPHSIWVRLTFETLRSRFEASSKP